MILFDSAIFSTVPRSTLNKWTAVLTQAYSDPKRHYHTLKHLESLRMLLDEAKAEFELTHADLQILHLAILFHDVVYVVPSETGYNEIKSALFFRRYAEDTNLERDICLMVEHIILCTIKHNLNWEFLDDCRFVQDPEVQVLRHSHSRNHGMFDESTLVRLFLDIDLSILATPQEKYDEYSSQIRTEYEYYPDEVFRQARMKALQVFLDREKLFFTPYFCNKFESQARQNIARELKLLE